MKMELFENALETGKNKSAGEDDYVALIMLFPCQASFPQTQIENNRPLT